MSTIETRVTKCDESGKTCERARERHKYEDIVPSDPWLSIRITGFWMSSFGKSVNTDRDACSPACAVAMMKKVVEKLERVKALEERVR